MRWTEQQLRDYELRTRRPVENAVTDAAPLEAPLHDQIESECRRRGWLAVHSRMDRPTTTGLGVADFIIFAAGRVFLIECKSRTGKLSTPQLAFAALAEKNKFTVEVVRSFAEFLAVIDKPTQTLEKAATCAMRLPDSEAVCGGPATHKTVVSHESHKFCRCHATMLRQAGHRVEKLQ